MEDKKNSYILDPEDPTELARLITLDSAITSSMSGPLAGVAPQTVFQHVLDLACGPGGWVLDIAFEQPEVEVAGVDISQSMISYANARARTQQRTNASFGVMDITEPLDFAEGAFDLINARFLVGILKGEQQWADLLAECFRLLRPGGMLRLAESDGLVVSTSPSLTHLQKYLLRTMQQRGYGFAVDGDGTLSITPVLPRLLRQARFELPVLTPWIFDFSHESPYRSEGFHLCEVTYQLAAQQHLLDNLLMDSAESMDILIRNMLIEMMRNDFGALTYGLIVCAMKPLQDKKE
jgi:ubiquinone/menaquinone biosynthesis C-methylase UbiE